jgi:hypothetical protein
VRNPAQEGGDGASGKPWGRSSWRWLDKVIPKQLLRSHRENSPRTEATSEMEALGEDMSREGGMRHCHHTAAFYLLMPGPQGRCARTLEGLDYRAQQMASSRAGGAGPESCFSVLAVIAPPICEVQGTSWEAEPTSSGDQ